jgi:hypothetical protein
MRRLYYPPTYVSSPYTHFQLNLSGLIIKELYSGQAKNKHGWPKFQYSVSCPTLPTMDFFTPLINQNENVNSKKIINRINKF